MSVLLEMLKGKLSELNIQQTEIQRIIHHLSWEDLLNVNSKGSKTREIFEEQHFFYIESTSIYLGTAAPGKQCFGQKVSIKETRASWWGSAAESFSVDPMHLQWFCYAENIYSRLVREKAFSSIITNLTDSVDTGIENDVGHTLTLTLVPFISICVANLGSPHVSAWKISVHIFVHTAWLKDFEKIPLKPG